LGLAPRGTKKRPDEGILEIYFRTNRPSPGAQHHDPLDFVELSKRLPEGSRDMEMTRRGGFEPPLYKALIVVKGVKNPIFELKGEPW
jgi:hypothetical protein